MKKIYFPAVAFLVIVIASISYFFYWFKKETSAVSDSGVKISFTAPRGKSASEIGTLLYNEGLIKNKLAFKIYVQFLDRSKNINAGEFELSPSMSVSEIVRIMGKGTKELWATIPEGLRKEEVVEKVIIALEMDKEKAEAFRTQFLTLAKDSEGYLFPDTYLFPREVPAEFVFNKLASTFDDKFDSAVTPLLKGKFSKKDVVIMASILERETKTADEKPVVAGILWKRIENDWPLQVDATVQYAIASQQSNSQQPNNWWPILTLDDLDIDSPYNTYRYKDLPVAPISNPGLRSLQAAANPIDSDYWFYIHSSDGVIHYAKSSAEHASNVRKYLGK